MHVVLGGRMGQLFKENSHTLFGINLVFMVTAVLLITLGYYLQVLNLYMGLLVTELIIILIPAVIYVRWKGTDIKQAFRLNSISPATLWRCVLITLCIYPAGLFLNMLSNMVLGLFGELIPISIPVADNGREYIINILVIALSAGVAEEAFFRGFLLNGYEHLGERKSILITAVLFGIFHFNIQNFIGPVFLGLVFGYLAIRTGSIIAPIAGHFINNAVSVTLMYAAGMVSGASAQGYEAVDNPGNLMAGLVFWGILALVGGFTSVRLFGRLKPDGSPAGTGEMNHHAGIGSPAPRLKDFIPVLLIAVIFIVFCIGELWVIIN